MTKEEKRLFILKYLTCTCRDDGKVITDDLKFRRLEELLTKTNSSYHLVKAGNLFRLYGRVPVETSDNIVVISTHADIVNDITKPWVSLEKPVLKGTFDNSAGDACAAILMYENKLPDNVFIAFTMNEEYGMKGAKAVNRYFKRIGKDFTAITLDVTYEGYEEHADYSIENIFFNKDTVAKVSEALKVTQGKRVVTPRGLPDEAWVYGSEKRQSCSVCVPTKGAMHSNSGLNMRSESFMRYVDAVKNIASSI